MRVLSEEYMPNHISKSLFKPVWAQPEMYTNTAYASHNNFFIYITRDFSYIMGHVIDATDFNFH
jgi:hypothetical protein